MSFWLVRGSNKFTGSPPDAVADASGLHLEADALVAPGAQAQQSDLQVAKLESERLELEGNDELDLGLASLVDPGARDALEEGRGVLEGAVEGDRADFEAVRDLTEEALELIRGGLLEALGDLLVELRDLVLLAPHIADRVLDELLELLAPCALQLVHTLPGQLDLVVCVEILPEVEIRARRRVLQARPAPRVPQVKIRQRRVQIRLDIDVDALVVEEEREFLNVGL